MVNKHVLYKQVLELFEQLDRPDASGEGVQRLFEPYSIEVTVKTVSSEKGSTDFIKIKIPGKQGKSVNGTAPTLGIIGRLGGLGTRPDVNGFVSDGDGALAALSSALKIAEMASKGDHLIGDVIITTHIDPDAPTQPHDPVPFMGSAVDIHTMNEFEVEEEMDAILSVDTTKGNRIINHTGVCISPTVKEGYILRVSDDLLDIIQNVTGELPVVLPITIQDITPYGNGVYHVNSILQPCVTTPAPVVGVAITASVAVPGCATGASRLEDVEQAARFCVEAAKLYGQQKISFYNEQEYQHLVSLYGDLKHLQTLGINK
jgi:hypothetical protein